MESTAQEGSVRFFLPTEWRRNSNFSVHSEFNRYIEIQLPQVCQYFLSAYRDLSFLLELENSQQTLVLEILTIGQKRCCRHKNCQQKYLNLFQLDLLDEVFGRNGNKFIFLIKDSHDKCIFSWTLKIQRMVLLSIEEYLLSYLFTEKKK